MLYILHAAQWADALFGVKDGMPLGQYLVHYADGSKATIPFVCGENVRDWWSYGTPGSSLAGKWPGQDGTRPRGKSTSTFAST